MRKNSNPTQVILGVIFIVLLLVTTSQLEKIKNGYKEKMENLYTDIDSLEKKMNGLEASFNQTKQIAYESEMLVNTSIQNIAQNRTDWMSYLAEIDAFLSALEEATTVMRQNLKENGDNLERGLYLLEEELNEAKRNLGRINPAIVTYKNQDSLEYNLKN